MDEESLNKKIRKLIGEIANASTNKRKKTTEVIQESEQQVTKEKLSKTENSLMDLSICIKYLLLDLEATRREKNMWKNKFEKQKPDN